MAFKITYSVLNADMTELHKEFDAALANVKTKFGSEFPSWIDGKAVKTGHFIEDYNPADTRQLLAKFHITPLAQLDRTVEVSKKAQKTWGRTPWQERAKIMRRAADLLSQRRMEIAAIMCLEVGKNRIEALGDVEESADLLRYYSGQLEESNGFSRPLAALSPNEKTLSVLKPFGVFGVIAPFNFPVALAVGMSGGALLGGNTVILKPSQDTPWCGEKIYECFRDAGLPEGVFQLIHGTGSEIGNGLLRHPQVDGIVFTGSKRVGMEIMHNFMKDSPKPCFLELGGKNPCIVSKDADLDKAADGIVRSAFGMSGQKCSALSRVYAQNSVKAALLEKILTKAKALKVGDQLDKDTFVGPVVNKTAYERYLAAAKEAQRDGKVHLGGNDIRSGAFANGWFVAPTLVEIGHQHRLAREELFLPFLTYHGFETLPEALQLANDCEYGLTAGFFSEKKDEVEYFMDNIEAGVLYSNRRTGATTGAWPGVQAFCGWKNSGSTGKGGCGPYYVAQFMREQSQTRME
ncbi:MAG: aldehyde dehydrogenase family protein [Bdellovibrionales bacterium]|nr:aldehyde dehydrogenase family protein [Bdellovibrionales bacterium]